ncbi:MAG: NFACT family protein [Lachnospiraceae bacterium]|nr:NFACT family protein [Lachnospiraceae bacterium]
MAFDGLTIAALVKELNDTLIGGRIYKITQPESDELLITVKQPSSQHRLFISADPSLPLIYLTENNKVSPMTTPNFCMLLRKHIQNGRVVSVTQPGLERIIRIDIEHLDEMGDMKKKTLVTEIMGKHSNIIFCDENENIIDSIKHIPTSVSSVREVLPGRRYFIANTQDKLNLLELSREAFDNAINRKSAPLYKALYGSISGLSPILSQELCYRAGLDGDLITSAFNDTDITNLFFELEKLKKIVQTGQYSPTVFYSGSTPVEYAAIPLTLYSKAPDNYTFTGLTSMSRLLEKFYAEKNIFTKMRQKTADIRRVVQNLIEKEVKKYDIQLKQINDTQKRNIYRVYGELLNTYGYSAKPGDKEISVINYYDNTRISIPLDETLSISENAQRYFDRYNKLKRTYENLSKLTLEVKNEIMHLESILTSIDIATNEEELSEIRKELADSGYIKAHFNKQKTNTVSKPFHYISSDGYDIYVGKNNYQNDNLTFKVANGNDWWFHAKKIPGSHVIVKSNGNKELPDSTFEEAARLAAYYSKGREQDKVEIDYVLRKEIKKPAGAKPGFVVYYTNYSMAIDSDISKIKRIE